MNMKFLKNGWIEVTVKGLSGKFLVETPELAQEIAWKLGGGMA